MVDNSLSKCGESSAGGPYAYRNEDSFKDEKKFEQRNIYDQTNQILCGLYYMKSPSMTFMLCSCEDVGAPTSTILYVIIFLYP